MNSEFLLFISLGLVAIVSALGMLQSRNAVYSALFLILNFCTVAVFYLMLGAPFIALTQVTVYAGAIMVLFLFVIMLLGAGEQQTQEQNRWQRPLAIFLGFILAAEAIYVLFLRADTRVNAAALPPVNAQIGDPHTIGEILFTDYLVPFEATGVLLLVAMVGAIVLTRARPPRVRASTVGTQAVGTQAVSPQTESVQPSKGARNDKC